MIHNPQNPALRSPGVFTVVLTDDAPDTIPEPVFWSADKDLAISWASQWLDDPLELAVAIYPPAVAVQEGGAL